MDSAVKTTIAAAAWLICSALALELFGYLVGSSVMIFGSFLTIYLQYVWQRAELNRLKESMWRIKHG